MQSFKASVPQHVSLTNTDLYSNSQSQFYLRGDDRGRHGSRLTDLGELEHSSGSAFIHIDAVNLSRSSDYSGFKASNVSVMPNNVQFGGLTNSLGSGEMGLSGIMGFGGSESLSNGHVKNWGDSLVEQQQKLPTDTSTNNADHGRNQFPGVQHKNLTAVNSMASSKAVSDQKALRRLAQNREAARKSRTRRKAYVQQLEDSRKRLTQLEQDIKRARTQGIFHASGISGERSHSMGSSGLVAFDIDYTQWLDEHQRLINDLRSAINSSHISDSELQVVVDEVMLHYSEVFALKSSGAKSDIFHILFGTWKTPAERCFMWLGGFRSSEILQVLRNQIEPLTEQQLEGINNLQGSSQQAEEALNQGMEALQQALFKTLSSTLGLRSSDNITDYMEQMTVAMSKLATLGDFLYQADLLRLKTLEQLRKILTTRQAARALLAFNDYKSRIRALSSLWLARPCE